MSVLAPYKEIASKLSSQYEKAKASGDLFAYESTIEHVEEDGVRVSCFAPLPSVDEALNCDPPFDRPVRGPRLSCAQDKARLVGRHGRRLGRGRRR